MNDNSRNTRMHNTVLGILTVAALGAVFESVFRGWEFWVPPLIIGGLVASWVLHIMQYRQDTFRENFYLIYAMVVAFYHGVHEASLFDIVVVSMLLMGTVTLLRRKEFLHLLLAEFFVILSMQLWRAFSGGRVTFDVFQISRIVLHVIMEVCAYAVLIEVININRRDTEDLEKRNAEKEFERVEMEDFLINISHELRTPVNVINGMSTLILNNETRPDVESIRDAGIRLSSEIADIQDISEIQRGDVILEDERYMITSLLNDVITTGNIFEENPELELVVDLDPNVPTMMKGDPVRIGKIIRHLLSNAFKFTRHGGVYLHITSIRREYGVNLVIEVTDTGIGMTAEELEKISGGIYQSSKKRNRSTGGIGMGLPIVYGFVRKMDGFVSVESMKGHGTTVKVSIAQEVLDPAPCLDVDNKKFFNIVCNMDPAGFPSPRVWEFCKLSMINLATALRINLYFTTGVAELERLVERGDITHVFSGKEEYLADRDYFEELSKSMTVALCVPEHVAPEHGNRVITMQGPVFGYSVVRILNGDVNETSPSIEERRPELDGLRALIVDDEQMNLVVASGLFKEYNMVIDTAMSGAEAIDKYADNEHDVVFMDHMMPEMDGVEAMKRIRDIAASRGKTARVIALTANVVSGAKEMFMNEGFAGFIGKPINISEFEHTMNRVFPGGNRS